MNTPNQIRNLSEVVTLEAWHDAFGEDCGRADLHVNVAFKAGRLGGGPNDTVRFRLTLKQAEVVVVASPNEPLRIDPRTVRRDARQRTGSVTETRRAERSASANAGANVKAGPAGGDASVDLGASAGASTKSESVTVLNRALSELTVVHGVDAAGDHCWSVTSEVADHLRGQVWDETDRMRLTVVDTRSDRSSGLPPSVTVEVRCRREDLQITDIVLVDETMWSKLKRHPLHRNRVAAAEAFLKSRLFDEGLLQGREGDLANPFATLTLALVAAEAV